MSDQRVAGGCGLEAVSSNNPRHRWSDARPMVGSNGLAQSERTCLWCGLVKITVHPPQGLPWREWRHPSNPQQFAMAATPPCQAGARE